MLLELYLKYLQEREWNEPEGEEIRTKNFYDLIKSLEDIKKINKIRNSVQPSLFSIYVKNSMGDYKGRITTRNSQSNPQLGISDFEKEKSSLKKKAKEVEKKRKKIINFKNK